MQRGYVGSRYGQLHYRQVGSGPHPPLLCLHATAYSGQTFEPLMPLLAAERRVIAIDTPGYGQSDGPPTLPPFETYAEAIADALPALVGDDAVDLFGFHTGALLATEMALLLPTRVRRLVIVGVPFFEGDERTAWRAKLVHETQLSEDFEQFRDRWAYFIGQRTPGLNLARAYACFVDELQAYPREWWAHAALFDYAAAERLPQVAQPTLVINPDAALAAASRRAAARMPHARVLEQPALRGAIFDLGPELLAQAVLPFLNGVDAFSALDAD